MEEQTKDPVLNEVIENHEQAPPPVIPAASEPAEEEPGEEEPGEEQAGEEEAGDEEPGEEEPGEEEPGEEANAEFVAPRVPKRKTKPVKKQTSVSKPKNKPVTENRGTPELRSVTDLFLRR